MSYKGWTNYNTWLVYTTKIFDELDNDFYKGFVFEDNGEGEASDPNKVVNRVKDYCEGEIDETEYGDEDHWNEDTIYFARAFMSQVDWRQIAQSLIDEFQKEEA
jgi:hypothetical protein